MLPRVGALFGLCLVSRALFCYTSKIVYRVLFFRFKFLVIFIHKLEKPVLLELELLL